MIKLYFWLLQYKWRIILISFIAFDTIAALPKNHSYLEAFIEWCGLYTVVWLTENAYIERSLQRNSKEAQEIAERIKR